MAKNSKIEWTDHTFNPWVGCTKISPGCDHCYAEGWAKRSGLVKWGPGTTRRRTSAAKWREPLKWNRDAANDLNAGELLHPRRPMVFCASLADVFDNEVPPEWRADLFELIRATPHLDWLLLTKRIGNVKSMVPWYSYRGSMEPQYYAPPNVWLGISVVNQEEAERDIPKLLAIPAAIRFLSCEPLLGPINLGLNLGIRLEDGTIWKGSRPTLDWVIVGGESGHGARPMEPQWAIDLVAQCQAVETAVFMKQGSQANWSNFKNFETFPPELQVRQWPVSA